METETPDAVTLVLAFVFMVSGAYSVLGHWVLYLILRERVKTERWLSSLPFYPVVVYFSRCRLTRTRWMDLLATTVAAAFVVFVVVALLLFAGGVPRWER